MSVPNPRWSAVKKTLREPIWTMANLAARPTATLRVLPDYLIIGAQRCGTTSLQEVLTTHPNITSARWMKGVHYFDTAYPKGMGWYRAHFPTNRAASKVAAETGSPLRVGEASPYYIYHPVALDRIAADLPEAKLILLLRDPVERTISHYKHEVRRGNEPLGLEEALDAEDERLAGEADRVAAHPGYNSFPLQTYSYLDRSRYAPQVRKLLSLFPTDQVMVLPAERFFDEPAPTYAALLRFLETPPFEPVVFPRMNATADHRTPVHVIDRIRRDVRESNEELFDMMGERYPWQ